MTALEMLADGVEAMGLRVSTDAQEKLIAYLDLLKKWNKVYNLTAVRKAEDMVVLHLLDSISILPYLKQGALLDVGSGAGLPGVVLAIINPSLQVTTIDTVQKKAIFMRQAKAELALENLTVVNARVEAFQPVEKYEQIVSRAFSEINLFINLTRHLLKDNGRWLAMKGMVPVNELQGLEIKPLEIIRLKVANLDAERHLVVFENKL